MSSQVYKTENYFGGRGWVNGKKCWFLQTFNILGYSYDYN